MQKKYLFLRGVVLLVCLYHIALGIILNSPANVISATLTHLFGATKLPDVTALFPARMLGTYMLVFGIGMGLAAWDPLKNRALLTVGCILTTLRAIQRVAQAEDLSTALGVTDTINWTAVAILLLIASIMAFFRVRLYKDMSLEQPV